MGADSYQITPMKKLLVLLVLLPMLSFGQERLTYTNVVKVDSISKNELYNRAKLWMASAYNSSNDVIQIGNKEEGQIIGKASIKYLSRVFVGSATTGGYIKYTIKIFVKEGRYKYEITDFIHDPRSRSSYPPVSMGLITTDPDCPRPTSMVKWSNKVWRDIKTQIAETVVPLVRNLKKDMSLPAETKNDDW